MIKRKNEKNVSNSPSKSKNKLNKNAPEEKGKKNNKLFYLF